MISPPTTAPIATPIIAPVDKPASEHVLEAVTTRDTVVAPYDGVEGVREVHESVEVAETEENDPETPPEASTIANVVVVGARWATTRLPTRAVESDSVPANKTRPVTTRGALLEPNRTRTDPDESVKFPRNWRRPPDGTTICAPLGKM